MRKGVVRSNFGAASSPLTLRSAPPYDFLPEFLPHSGLRNQTAATTIPPLYFFVLLHSLLVLLSSSPVSLISFPHLVFLRRRRFKRICHGGNNLAAAALSQSVSVYSAGQKRGQRLRD